MAYLLDGLILLLFGGMIYLGYRQGLVRTLSGVLSFVLALALTAVLAPPAAEWVYDYGVHPTVAEQLETHIGQDSPAAEKVDAALAAMPAYIRNRLAVSGVQSGADLLAWMGKTEEETPSIEWVEQKGIRPFVLPPLKAICSFVLFTVLSLLLNLLFRLLSRMADLPGIQKVNKGMGLVAGVLQGILWVFLVVTLLDWITLGEMVPLFREELLNTTLLVRWLREVNPLGETVRRFFTVM